MNFQYSGIISRLNKYGLITWTSPRVLSYSHSPACPFHLLWRSLCSLILTRKSRAMTEETREFFLVTKSQMWVTSLMLRKDRASFRCLGEGKTRAVAFLFRLWSLPEDAKARLGAALLQWKLMRAQKNLSPIHHETTNTGISPPWTEEGGVQKDSGREKKIKTARQGC